MNEKKMTQEQARKILSEYLALDSEEHNEFLDAIRTLIQPQAEIQCGHSTEEIEKSFMEDVEAVKEQLPNEDLISRTELLKALETWDKFGCNAVTRLIPIEDDYVPYIHYDDVVKCIKGMPCVAIPTDRDLMLDITEAINDGKLKAYTEDGTIYLDDGNNRLAVPSAEPSGDAVSRQAVLNNLCNSCTNIGCEFQSGIVRTECAFYMPPHIESDNCGNYVVIPPAKPQESSRDMEEIEEIINCDADAETKCKMISNILTAKPHYFEEQEPKTGHCEDCKQFRKLPYHADTLGKCIHHTGFCPKGDWYCADFEPQESEE